MLPRLVTCHRLLGGLILTSLLAAGSLAAETAPFQFRQADGALVAGEMLSVFDSAGRLVAKLPGNAEGGYLVPVTDDQKFVFEFADPKVAPLGPIEHAGTKRGATGFVGVTVPEIVIPPDWQPKAHSPNDDCEGAIRLTANGPTETGDTTGTEPDVPPAFTCNTTISDGDWYVVAGTGNTMTATTCLPGTDGSFDTKVSVFCGSCVAGLTCINGNDDNCSSGVSFLHSTTSWPSQLGADYLILVHGFAGDEGPFEIGVTDDGVPADATVECLPTGACCTCLSEPFNCSITTEAHCDAMGGTWQGEDTECTTAVGGVSVDEISDGLSIPIDSTMAPAVDTMTVADSGTVVDVNIDVQLVHTWLGDLDIVIEHAGISVNIFDSECGSNDDMDVLADDEAADVACGSPTTGSYNPESTGGDALSAFDGTDVNGDWTITVTDNAGGDIGALNGWSVHAETGVLEPTCAPGGGGGDCEPCLGNEPLFAGCAAGAENHGDFVSCVTAITNQMKADGLISGAEKGRIVSCAAKSDLP